MQEPYTGLLREIDEELFEELKSKHADNPSSSIPPAFREGERVTVEGSAGVGHFRISHIGRRKMVLRGIPKEEACED